MGLDARGVTEVTTTPVGVITLSALGLSDTALCPTLEREKVFTGVVETVSGNTITVSGSPGWVSNQFVYSSTVQRNTYYLLISSGLRSGAFYTVTGNTGNSMTVDPAGENLQAILASGVMFDVVPYWTLNTLFPSGQGFKVSPSFTPVSTIIIPNPNQVGASIPASDKYFYYNGTALGGAGWRKVGGVATTKYDDMAIMPDSHFIVRHNYSGNTEFKVIGRVRTSGFQTAIGTIQPNTRQDNHLGFPYPVPMTLTKTGFYQSGAVAGSTSFTPTDLVLVYDNSITALNKPPTAKYFYYTGTALGGAGWRKVGATATAKFDDVEVIAPGVGFIIQKAPVASPSSQMYTSSISY